MELSILHTIQSIHTPWLDPVMIFVSFLGNGGLFWIALSVILVCFKRTRRCGVLMMIAMAVCFVAGNLAIKNLVARPRPFVVDPSVILKVPIPGEYSFPSGHTMNGFSAATVIFLHNRKAGTAALCFAALIAFSRMYLFVHFPTDILGGLIIGVSAAFLSVKIIGKKIKYSKY